MHFRKPLDEDTIDFRAVQEGKHQYEIIQEDAKPVMKLALKLIDKDAMWLEPPADHHGRGASAK